MDSQQKYIIYIVKDLIKNTKYQDGKNTIYGDAYYHLHFLTLRDSTMYGDVAQLKRTQILSHNYLYSHLVKKYGINEKDFSGIWDAYRNNVILLGKDSFPKPETNR